MTKRLGIALSLITSLFLSGCISNIWTGASLIYDRHDIYKKASDFTLAGNANRALYKGQVLKCEQCAIDVAVLNGDILLAGHVPNETLRQEAQARVMKVPGYRRLFNQLSARPTVDNALKDSWITAKIRSVILADADIDPDQFKIVTSDSIVYLLGDVRPNQAAKVILIARQCAGVRRVVKLFKYYHLSDKAELPV